MKYFFLAILLLMAPIFINPANCENISDKLVLKDLVPPTYFLLETESRIMVKPFPEKTGTVTMEAKGAAYKIEMLMMLPEGGTIRFSSQGSVGMLPFPEIPTKDGQIVLQGPGVAEPLVWFNGVEHIFMGKMKIGAYSFDSDPNYPLTFKTIKGAGCVYLCGRGTVTRDNGSAVRLGYNQKVNDWIAILKDTDKLKRQSAIQAIGWLASTTEEKARVIPLLVALLSDPVMEVRRDSAEVLGKIGDPGVKKALSVVLKDNNEWVRKVADESLALLDMRSTPKLETLLANLKHENALVRSVAAEKIGELKDKQAISALQEALQQEKDNDVKKVMEEATQKLQK